MEGGEGWGHAQIRAEIDGLILALLQYAYGIFPNAHRAQCSAVHRAGNIFACLVFTCEIHVHHA